MIAAGAIAEEARSLKSIKAQNEQRKWGEAKSGERPVIKEGHKTARKGFAATFTMKSSTNGERVTAR